jgi:hypothetical protein
VLCDASLWEERADIHKETPYAALCFSIFNKADATFARDKRLFDLRRMP